MVQARELLDEVHEAEAREEQEKEARKQAREAKAREKALRNKVGGAKALSNVSWFF